MVADTEFGDQMLLDLFEQMLTIRRYEERVAELFRNAEFPGFVHLCNGQEAVAVGSIAHLRRDDYITVTHRAHGQYIAKGVDLDRFTAELFGRRTGYCGGKGGEMHVGVPELGILGGYGIVGGGIPIATGAALSAKMRGSGQIAMCFFGDGAVNQGTFHESVNLASCWKLPVVYICENNQWAVTTRHQDVCSVAEISQRAIGYGIPGATIDGNDMKAVYTATGEAVARARRGEGPTLLECCTYRLRSHTEGLDEILRDRPYRDTAEVELWQTRDPLLRLQQEIEARGVPAETFGRLDEAVRARIAHAVAFAKESPWPEPADGSTGLFAIGPDHVGVKEASNA